MIPTALLDSIRARVALSDVVDGLKARGRLLVACCPFHAENVPSFTVYDDQRYRCYGCGAAGDVFAFVMARDGLSFVDAARVLADRAGVRLDDATPEPRRRRNVQQTAAASFSAADARAVWDLALERARDDESVEADRDVWRYLNSRQLTESFEVCAFGIVDESMPLPQPIRWWPAKGYRVVVPLRDQLGKVVSLQACNVLGRKPKVMNPPGSLRSDAAFASREQIAVMRDESDAEVVVMVEGLSDYLALCAHASLPVLGIPGVSNACWAVGPWIRGRELVLALDDDDAGRKAAAEVAERAVRVGARTVRQVIWTDAGGADACEVLARLGPREFGDEVFRWISSRN